jgi:light-regulated signal transduction histidine kinase (bacteriophytochrome)
MSTMIDDLLSFSRLGRKDLVLNDSNINLIINEIIEQIKPDSEKYNIKWIIHEIPNIKGDKNLLKLAFENLITNAIKYSSKNKNVIIEIGSQDFGDHIEIFIKDNGVGFDMNYVDKLFGVFQRLHSSEEFEGTGIGLANVKQIINKHGGTVKAESVINEGSVFYVSLPKK